MVLEALENILDINFSPDIDINVLNITRIEGHDRLRPEGDVLHVNIEELEPEQVRELQQLPQMQFEGQERVLRDREEDETMAMESGYDEDHEDVLDYFDGILPDRYLNALEESLYLQVLVEERDLTKDEILTRKQDISDRHNLGSTYFCSLTTAGYFYPDGGLRDLYVKMGVNPEYDRYNYFDELETLIENRLICVFVDQDEDVHDVVTETRGRLARYQKMDPIHEWLDIKGIGPGCADIIDGTLQELQEQYISLDFDRWTDNGEVTVRIHPHSLPPIGFE